MPHYYSLGKIPQKRHVVFPKPEGGMYYEQLVSTEGFSDTYSLVYHSQQPTMVKHIGKDYSVAPEILVDQNMQHRSFKGFNAPAADDYLDSRIPVLVNDDVHISLAAPRKSMKDYFFKNADK